MTNAQPFALPSSRRFNLLAPGVLAVGVIRGNEQRHLANFRRHCADAIMPCVIARRHKGVTLLSLAMPAGQRITEYGRAEIRRVIRAAQTPSQRRETARVGVQRCNAAVERSQAEMAAVSIHDIALEHAVSST